MSDRTIPHMPVGLDFKEGKLYASERPGLSVRGVTVNTIIPTVIDGAGIFTHLEKDAPIREFVKSYNPMGRMARVEDVANVAEFFASDLSAFVSGQHLLISGGAPS